MQKLVRLLLFGLLAFLTVFVAYADVHQQQEVREVELIQAANDGLISYTARGTGGASGAVIELTITYLTDEPLRIHIQAGTRFLPDTDTTEAESAWLNGYSGFNAPLLTDSLASPLLSPALQGGAQGMAANDWYIDPEGFDTENPNPEFTYVAQQNHTTTVTLEAYCINAHLDNPSESITFTAQPPPDDDLTRLMETYAASGDRMSVVALQIAVWILTDDVDLAFLEQVGYDPTDQELRDALLLIQEAGIDISDRQLGQIEIPPAAPEPSLSTTEPTSVHIRGTVIGDEGTALEDARVVIRVSGPNHSAISIDITSERGRFDGSVNLYADDSVTISVYVAGHEIASIGISAQELFELVADGGELVIRLSSREPEPTEEPTITEEPPVVDDTTETPEAPDSGSGITPIDPPLFGVRLSASGANVRSEPSTSGAVVNVLRCGVVVTIDAQATGSDGFVWYRVSAGGWVRSDLINVYGSEAEAESAAAVCVDIPTPTPSGGTTGDGGTTGGTGDGGGGTTTGGDTTGGGGTGGGGTGGGEPTPLPSFSITIINNAPCDLSGSFGPAGFSVSAGGSTSVSVPYGSHHVSAGGSCGSLNTDVFIDSDAEFTIGT